MRNDTALSKRAQANKGKPLSGVDLLDLPGWKTIKTETENKKLLIYAEVEQAAFLCEKCGAPMARNGHITRQTPQGPTQQIKIGDSPIRGNGVSIVCRKQKYKCSNKDCGWTKVPPLPGICETGKNRQMTARLRDHIIEKAPYQSNRQLAAELHISESTIRDILKEGRSAVGTTPHWIGVDEVHIGGKYRFVIYDIIEKRLYEILESNDSVTVENYFENLPEREKVEVIVMDMSRDYRASINRCKAADFNPIIVADKFHVMKLATRVLADMRIAVGKQLTKKERVELQKNGELLVRSTPTLTKEELALRSEMFVNYPLLKAGYEARLKYVRLWEPIGVRLPNPEEVEQRMVIWYQGLSAELKPYFESLWKTINEWNREILAYFTPGLELENGRRPTNGPLESYNRLIREVDQMGRYNNDFATFRLKVLMRYGQADALNWDKAPISEDSPLEFVRESDPEFQSEPKTQVMAEYEDEATPKEIATSRAITEGEEGTTRLSMGIVLEMRGRQKKNSKPLPLFDWLVPNQSECAA